MNVFLGNEEEGTILVVDEAFRLVLSTNLSEVPPGLLSVKDLAVVNFDLSNSLDTILLHRVVQIEDASLRKELDKLRMEGAAAALDLSSMQQQVLLFLSSSDGLLLTDSNEMSKLLVLKKDHQRIQYSATLARESLDICIRSEQQFRLLAVAASEVHQVLTKLAQELNDSSFFWGYLCSCPSWNGAFLGHRGPVWIGWRRRALRCVLNCTALFASASSCTSSVCLLSSWRLRVCKVAVRTQ